MGKRSRSEIATVSGCDGKYTQRVKHPCRQDLNKPIKVEREQGHNQFSEDTKQECIAQSIAQDLFEEGNALQHQKQPHQQEDADVKELQLIQVQAKEEVKKESAIFSSD